MIELSKFPAVKYTMTEYHIFSALPKNGKQVGTDYIAEKQGKEWKVRFPIKNIVVVMSRLINKVEANKEPFRICKQEKMLGHYNVKYWIEPRVQKKKVRSKK